MKLVYSNENAFFVNNVKNLIEAQGIESFIKNEFAQGAVGEISAFDAWPELWVVNDSDRARAEELITTSQIKSHGADWICNACLEKNGASFDFCWKCQGEKA